MSSEGVVTGTMIRYIDSDLICREGADFAAKQAVSVQVK